MSLLYIFLAGLGLSFLVFIHELGHFIVARRLKMRVEVFSIGLGKPIFAWTHKGVKWQVCYLLFGGYVKIAGMERENGQDPRDVKDGFYGKSPFARILVAIIGPLVNIVFALLVFTAIWTLGGRAKPFDEFTHMIGWIDPASELAEKGVHPGDTIVTYNGRPFNGFRDLIYNGILNENSTTITGEKINYLTGSKETYDYKLTPYHRSGMPNDMKTIGVLQPASLLFFNGYDTLQKEACPLYSSGIETGDRIVWANGQMIFSLPQLSQIVNEQSAFLTIRRGGEILHVSAPRISLNELQLTNGEKNEFIDWKRELSLKEPLKELFFLNHAVDEFGTVGKKYPFIDADLITKVSDPLQEGDKVLAVYGREVKSGLDVFNEIAHKKVLLIVQKTKTPLAMTFQNQDAIFQSTLDLASLKQAIEAIGMPNAPKEIGAIKTLNPITPITYDTYLQKTGRKNFAPAALSRNGKDLEYIFIGAVFKDQLVNYNPTPFVVFEDVAKETWFTLSSLVGGRLSPKWLSGPVGIVKVMHDGLSLGLKEALYWLGLISLNLGLVNLLPIPVLDGGHICFALWELFTKKPISSKTMERMVLPFVVLLILFFVYVTYQDVLRLFFH